MPTTTLPVDRQAIRYMYLGLALTVLAAVAPALDLVTLDIVADHVRNAYPNWPDDMVAADRNAIVGYMAGVGVLGIGCWLWAIAGVRKRSSRARLVSTILFSVGAIMALTDLTFSGEAYTTNVIPYLYGTLGLLPTVPGLLAVVRLWRPKQPVL